MRLSECEPWATEHWPHRALGPEIYTTIETSTEPGAEDHTAAGNSAPKAPCQSRGALSLLWTLHCLPVATVWPTQFQTASRRTWLSMLTVAEWRLTSLEALQWVAHQTAKLAFADRFPASPAGSSGWQSAKERISSIGVLVHFVAFFFSFSEGEFIGITLTNSPARHKWGAQEQMGTNAPHCASSSWESRVDS